MEDSIDLSDDSTVPVFRLQDMKIMYQKQMKAHGASTGMADLVHTTRFKQKLLENIPGLCESKDGRCILLTLDGQMGRALFEACRSSNHEDGMVIAKAASIVRRDMFIRDEIFDGDLSRHRQTLSVSSTLLQLVSLILEGGKSAEMP